MIKNYILGDTHACWGVSRITHLPILGDDGLARSGNKVLLQIEHRDSYARRALSPAEALEVASLIAGAIIHVQIGGPTELKAIRAHYSVTASSNGIVLSLLDAVSTPGQFAHLPLPATEAQQMIKHLGRDSSEMLERIIHGAPSEPDPTLDDLRKLESALVATLDNIDPVEPHHSVCRNQLTHVRTQIAEHIVRSPYVAGEASREGDWSPSRREDRQ